MGLLVYARRKHDWAGKLGANLTIRPPDAVRMIVNCKTGFARGFLRL